MKSYFRSLMGSNRAIVSLTAISMLLGGLALTPATAHADSFTAYTITDAQFQGGTLSGTFEIDKTTGNAANIDLVLTNGSATFTYIASSALIFDNGIVNYFEVDLVPGNNTNIAGLAWLMSAVSLSSPPTSFNLSAVSNVSGVGIMGFDGSNRDFLTGGTAVDPGPNSIPTGVPEPSTLLLLASGLMPIGFFSRRWMARHPR
jgi:hypothetical protein